MATITNIREEEGELKFTLAGDVSIANALRRIILTDIEIYGFVAFPHEETTITIHTNTSRFNNEILKQRLACVPVKLDADEEYPELSVSLDITNLDHRKKLDVFIRDFMVVGYDKNIFEPSTDILFARLGPKLAEDIEAEKIQLTATLKRVSAKMDGCYNVVSTCSYGNTRMPIEGLRERWNERRRELVGKITEQELEVEEKNWYIHDAQRHYIPNSFEFVIESVGIYDNKDIMRRACRSIINRLKNIGDSIKPDHIDVIDKHTHVCRIKLENETHTIGCLYEAMIYTAMAMNPAYNYIQMCNFRKAHPHDTYGILRIDITLGTENPKQTIIGVVQDATAALIGIFDGITRYFSV